MSNSDYKKARTDLLALLPEVHRSNANKAIFENLFNRFLTKPELTTAVGTIGQRNLAAEISNQLDEPTTARQANQLQPLMQTTIATKDYMSSYKDVLQELDRLGVDIERLDEWGKARRFTFAPPINIDKLVNYQDYYWYNPYNINSEPQYVTIATDCSRYTAQYNQRQAELKNLEATGADPVTISNKEAEIEAIFENMNSACPGMAGFDLGTFDDSGNFTDYDPNNNDLFEIPQHGVSEDPTDPPVDVPLDWAEYGEDNWGESAWPGDSSGIPKPTGKYSWDQIGDGVSVVQNQWQDENKWFHKSDVENISAARQAAAPIIEFASTLEMNEWTVTSYQWKYRLSHLYDWSVAVEEPSNAEIIAGQAEKDRLYEIFFLDPVSDTIIIQGDVTTIFPIGLAFSAIDDTGYGATYLTVDTVSYDGTNTTITTIEDLNIAGTVSINILSVNDANNTFTVNGHRINTFTANSYVEITNSTGGAIDGTYTIASSVYDGNNTIVTVNEDITSSPISPGIVNQIYGILSPISQSSLGDPWKTFYEHWTYVEKLETLPTSHQDLNPNVGLTGIEQFVIPASSSYSLFVMAIYDFLVGNDDIRVFVDDVQQYGTYQEGYVDPIEGFVPIYTKNQVGVAINFFDPIVTGDEETKTVRIETYAAIEDDVPRERPYIRTTEDDTTFSTTGPEQISLIRYRYQPQVKIDHFQYPLFNLYNIDGTTANQAVSLFSFLESDTQSVDVTIGLRVVKNNDHYVFSHPLQQDETGVLYCYKDTTSITLPDNPDGLQTIWRQGLNGEEYVPRKVNEYNLHEGDTYRDYTGTEQTVTLDSTSDWEIADTWYHNANHELRSIVAYDEIYTHFNSIIDLQEMPSDFVGTKRDLFRTLDAVNWGVGGTILEHNNNADILYSSIFVNSATPTSVIDFARVQYENNLNIIREYFETHLVDIISSMTFQPDLASAVSDDIIDAFERNDAAGVVFGDSTTYDTSTQLGIKNWIATLPLLRIVSKQFPILLRDDKRNVSDMIHHDGHKSNITLSTIAINSIVSNMRKTVVTTEGPTANRPTWQQVSSDEYFYDTTTQNIYRFAVASVGEKPPSSTYSIGTYWLNTVTGILMIRVSGIPEWTPVNGIVGDIDIGWELVVVNDLYKNCILEIEQRLYDVSPTNVDMYWNVANAILTSNDQIEFDRHLEQFFLDYVIEKNIDDPYVTDFNILDAFTWNYKSVSSTVVRYPSTISQTNLYWGARWYHIYDQIFNTQYPHLQPWRLQQYTDKPTWWDANYKWSMDDSRRWEPIMWTNIGNGIVPLGELLPTGIASTGVVGEVPEYTHFCVNITSNTTTDGYGPDDVLPPYWVPPTTNPEDVAVGDQVLLDNILDITDTDERYVYGDQGPIEYDWINSVRYFYDELKASFRLQPLKFMSALFYTEKTTIAGLEVSARTNKVYSHTNVVFHGDIVNNLLYQTNSLNQWYVCYHRFKSYDVNLSDFRQMWTGWNMKLSYQTSTFFNTQTLLLSSDHYDITIGDYVVKTKITLGDKDFWINSLQVKLLEAGSWQTGKHTAHDWVFQLDTPSPVSEEVSYYYTKNYDCTVDVLTDTFTIIDGDRTIPWETGSSVIVLSSTATPPVPFVEYDNYFIIKESDTTFKLASSMNDATNNIAIDITTIGYGTIQVAELLRTFDVLSKATTPTLFDHFVLDERTERPPNITFPIQITGMQRVIDFIDGYVKQQEELGAFFNDTAILEIDADTGRPTSWQVEIERFINAFYQFGENYITGMSGNQPALTKFTHEINPLRNNIWINHQQGIIADIVNSPFEDMRVQQGVYDQYGTPIDAGNVQIYREDTRSRIVVKPELQNDLHIPLYQGDIDEYSWLHIGGAHIIINTHEHTIVFNDYTTGGELIYDPFVGLNHALFNVQFDKQMGQYTLRPNIGGYFLNEGKLLGNIEAATEGMQKFYDVFRVNESTDITKNARELIGFSSSDYYRQLGITPKSEFVFWRGLIQQKGTNNALSALANLNTIKNLEVDEFWAYKLAEFGDAREQEYFELHIDPLDVSNTVKLQFIDNISKIDNTSLWLTGENTTYENSTYTLNILGVNPEGDLKSITYTIDWGDGTTEQISGTMLDAQNGDVLHTYIDDPDTTVNEITYDITVLLVDLSHTVAAHTKVTVLNVIPEVTLDGNGTIAEGDVFNLTIGPVVDVGNDTVTDYTISWGDGTNSSYTSAELDGLNRIVTHTYIDGLNTYTISVTLTDEDGSHTNANTLEVVVTNVAPTVVLTGNSTANEGTVYTLTIGEITDPGDDTVTDYQIDWGDGTVVAMTADDLEDSGGQVVHTYNTISSRVITVYAVDEDGIHQAGTLNVDVISAAPVIYTIDPIGIDWVESQGGEPLGYYNNQDASFGGLLPSTQIDLTGNVYYIDQITWEPEQEYFTIGIRHGIYGPLPQNYFTSIFVQGFSFSLTLLTSQAIYQPTVGFATDWSTRWIWEEGIIPQTVEFTV